MNSIDKINESNINSILATIRKSDKYKEAVKKEFKNLVNVTELNEKNDICFNVHLSKRIEIEELYINSKIALEDVITYNEVEKYMLMDLVHLRKVAEVILSPRVLKKKILNSMVSPQISRKSIDF